MSEPENHTLHLLREIRDDIRKLEHDVREDVRKLDRKVDDLKVSLDSFVQTLTGEIADRVYASGGVERRLADIERRLAALEQDRRETS